MSSITVSLPDGSERELPVSSTPLDLAASIGSGLKKAAVAATVNGTDTDLTHELRDGDVVAIITNDTDEGRHVLRHFLDGSLPREADGGRESELVGESHAVVIGITAAEDLEARLWYLVTNEGQRPQRDVEPAAVDYGPVIDETERAVRRRRRLGGLRKEPLVRRVQHDP